MPESRADARDLCAFTSCYTFLGCDGGHIMLVVSALISRHVIAVNYYFLGCYCTRSVFQGVHRPGFVGFGARLGSWRFIEVGSSPGTILLNHIAIYEGHILYNDTAGVENGDKSSRVYIYKQGPSRVPAMKCYTQSPSTSGGKGRVLSTMHMSSLTPFNTPSVHRSMTTPFK